MTLLLIAGLHQRLCKFEQYSVCSEHSWQYRRRDHFNYLRAEQLVHPLDRLLLPVIPGMAIAVRSGLEVFLPDDALDGLDGSARIVQHGDVSNQGSVLGLG